MIVVVAVMVLFGVVLHLTPSAGPSRWASAPRPLEFVGIKVNRAKFCLYVATGLVSSMAGIFWTLRYSSARSDNASGLELAVIAGVLLGGVSIFGGKGSIPGVIAGVLLIGVINYALRLQRISDVVLIIVTGSLLILSVVGPRLAEGLTRCATTGGFTATSWVDMRRPSHSPDRPMTRPRAQDQREALHGKEDHGSHANPAAHASGLAAIAALALSRRPAAEAAEPGAKARPGAAEDLTITFIPKQLNNPYTDVVLGGGKEGATAAGFASADVVGPLEASASSQVSFINAETQAGTNVIVIAANDPDAVGPALTEARDGGAKIVAFDSDTAPQYRDVFISQVVAKDVALIQTELIAEQIGGSGEIAILSATANATNQNEWIKFMEEDLKTNPEYKDIKLVAKVYGDDDDTKSFQEAQGLLQAYPNLKGIISPTTVGIAATARYLSTSKYKGKVALTGLGLPNEMRAYVKDDTVEEFALWDPAQLATSPRTRARPWPTAPSPASRATSSPPATSASTRSRRATSSSSVRRPGSTPRTSTSTTSSAAPGGSRSGSATEPCRACPARIAVEDGLMADRQRVCFRLQVRPDRMAEYAERHAAVWPEMLEALRDTGWHNYSLFLGADGLLIGYFETDDLEAALAGMAAPRSTPAGRPRWPRSSPTCGP